MTRVFLAAFLAIAVTAGIASAGIASLANGAAILINASSHSVSPADISGLGRGAGGSPAQTAQEPG